MQSPFPFLLVAACALAGPAEPCWQAADIEGDPLFFIQDDTGRPAQAALLRTPVEAPIIRSASGETVYEEGRDFSWKRGAREVWLLPGSRIPFKTVAELHPPPGAPNAYAASRDGPSWLLYSQGRFFHDLQCAAYYRAADDWTPPRVESAPEEQLIRIRRKLKAKAPVTLVVLGDSISTGLNASVTGDVEPRQEGYVNLVAQRLEKRFGARVTVKNLSVSGKSSRWGVEQVSAVVGASPDLFLCAFGMNDASGRRPTAEFTDTLLRIIESVQSACPDCDAVVVTSMTANPEWNKAAPELYPAYAAAVKALARPGVAVANVTMVWSALLSRKGFFDLTGNGLNHPNDFGHRVYADVILETIGH